MKLSVAALLVVVSMASMAQVSLACAGDFTYCGEDSTGVTASCCNPSLTCRKINQWYYQCDHSWIGSPAPAPAPAPSACRGHSEYCGEDSNPNAFCCVAGMSCVYVNQWWHECRPGYNAPSPAPSSLTGTFTRYWDCCKPTCSWPSSMDPGATYTSSPVRTCGRSGTGAALPTDRASVCGGGGYPAPPTSHDNLAYTCNDYQPFYASNGDLRAFVASKNSKDCCRCIEVDFANGKKMVAQVINTGEDVGSNHFDIQVPGGGLGIFDGCTSDGVNEGTSFVKNGYQYNHPEWKFGARYGGVWNDNKDCGDLPSAIRSGCNNFKNFCGGISNAAGWTNNIHTMNYRYVSCPSELTSRSGCSRTDV